MTLVTGVLDLGRAELSGWGQRPFEFYTTNLQRLLRRYYDTPMVVHIAPQDEPLVWRCRKPENTLVVRTTLETLRAMPYYPRVQTIRTSARWGQAAAWLQDSPQRLLEGYLPLVLAKPYWLCAVAASNPFGSERVVWMDGGLPGNPVYARLSRRRFVRGLDIDRFRVLGVPYTTNQEIHGFDRQACARYCATDFVAWIVRGGLFGGTPAAIERVTDLYDALLKDTLAHGHLGTEETLLTILAHRHPALLRHHMLSEG
jgi:hypothetical protein